MKKLFFALLVGAFVFSYALSASATEIKTYGFFRAFVSHVTNYSFDEDTDGSEFTAAQRLRPYFDFIANENLKLTFALEWDTTWGKKKVWDADHYKNAGGAAGMDVAGVTELKRAYITFKWPNTDITFKIGAQPVALPGAFGASPVLDDDITGAVVTAPINDMFSVSLGWVRPWLNEDGNAGIGAEGGEAIDALFLSLPMKLEGINVTPYFVYAFVGDRALDTHMGEVFVASGAVRANPNALSKDDSSLWYAGMTYKISMFEPITIKGDVLYGSLDSDIKVAGDDDAADREGWFVSLAVDYKMDMMTPSIYGYYFSGDDDDPMDGSECIPLLATDGWWTTPGGWAIGQTTTFFFNDNNYAIAQGYPDGIWLIGFALKDISLVENLKSTFAVEYGQGTVDSDLIKKYGKKWVANYGQAVTFTDEDSFVQVMLDSKYKIYENLAAVLELGYASLDMDEDTWGKDYKEDDAYLVTFGFTYDF